MTSSKTTQQQAADQIEQAHMRVGEETGLFIARTLGSAGYAPWLWHRIEVTSQPTMTAACGFDLAGQHLPERRQTFEHGCDECRVTAEEYGTANAILREEFAA